MVGLVALVLPVVPAVEPLVVVAPAGQLVVLAPVVELPAALDSQRLLRAELLLSSLLHLEYLLEPSFSSIFVYWCRGSV